MHPSQELTQSQVTRVTEAGTGPSLFERAAFTATSMTIQDTHLPFDQWAEMGTQLKHIEGSVNWWIGDWLNFGQKVYGDDFAQEVDIDHYNFQTIRQAKWVASRFERDERNHKLSWSHYRTVAARDDRHELIQLALDNNWSKKELAEEVRARKQAELPEPAPRFWQEPPKRVYVSPDRHRWYGDDEEHPEGGMYYVLESARSEGEF